MVFPPTGPSVTKPWRLSQAYFPLYLAYFRLIKYNFITIIDLIIIKLVWLTPVFCRCVGFSPTSLFGIDGPVWITFSYRIWPINYYYYYVNCIIEMSPLQNVASEVRRGRGSRGRKSWAGVVSSWMAPRVDVTLRSWWSSPEMNDRVSVFSLVPIYKVHHKIIFLNRQCTARSLVYTLSRRRVSNYNRKNRQKTSLMCAV